MKSLSVSSWNIQGLCSSAFGLKSTDPEFISSIKSQDIVILLETWCRDDTDTHCPSNYREILLPSLKHKHTRHGRDSGGVIVWYKEDLSSHLKIIKKATTHIWLKLNQNIAKCDNDMYICAAYTPPLESPYYDENFFENLHKEIRHYQAQGNVLLVGDLNARTGCEPDIVDPAGNSHIFGQSSLHLTPTTRHRHNQDHIKNKMGKELVHLCGSLGLYMLNGRMKGDSLGRFTYCSALGTSVVDYAITDMDPSLISAFTVRPQTPLSDHCQINVYIKPTVHKKITEPEPCKLHQINNQYKWTPDGEVRFKNVITSPEITCLINTFLSVQFQPNQSNMAVTKINYIYHKSASKAGLIKNNSVSKQRLKKEEWYDKDCKNVRKKLRQQSNLKHHQPQNTDLRQNYVETLREYKQIIRHKKKQYHDRKLREIEESIDQNQFWERWNNLNNKKDNLALQNGNIWKDHFEKLYEQISPNNLNHEQRQTREKLTILESTIKNNQNPLDYLITMKELENSIKKLKSGKACGPDGIRTEMLKHSSPELKQALLQLFNLVLQSGCFPEIWSRGLISPIHKSGDKMDPNNYRGICVSSNLGKVFCSIINARILAFLMEHNALSKGQIGFLPNHRTTDHVYTLHTLINHHVHQKNKSKIFACFIDFKKAFDSIWQEGLYYKLLQIGIGGKIYDIIKSMYVSNKCGVKIGNKTTDLFTQGRGVFQGNSLSPTLFNIYINDLAVLLERSGAPGLTLNNQEVKFLLYADDLVLLSPTQQGLQQHLDLLEQYCQNWALTVNFNKSKIMIFQKKPRSQESKYQFKLGNAHLDHTLYYDYLGLKISASGNFGLAVNALKEKACRAFYAIRRKFYKLDIPIRIWTKIFDSVIQPIALYGSEVWGPLTHQDFTRWDKHPIEALHAELCRSILNIQRKTPTNACRAELGRYPLIINIKKTTLTFWLHLKLSPQDTLSFQALQTQELNPQKSPFCQLVLRLTDQITPSTVQPQTSTAFQPLIRVNQIIKLTKDAYLEHWTNQTKTQNKLNHYLALNHEYKLAEYLFTVRDTKQRQILTKYRLSDHSLAIEKGRHKKSWLPTEQRVCGHCTTGEVETEMHFLLKCDKYNHITVEYFQKFDLLIPDFTKLEDCEKQKILLGEGHAAHLAAQYVIVCHKLRDT